MCNVSDSGPSLVGARVSAELQRTYQLLKHTRVEFPLLLATVVEFLLWFFPPNERQRGPAEMSETESDRKRTNLIVPLQTIPMRVKFLQASCFNLVDPE